MSGDFDQRIDVLHQAKSVAESRGISFSSIERPALNRVIVRLDKGKMHWVNECRDDESHDVWLQVLAKGIAYIDR